MHAETIVHCIALHPYSTNKQIAEERSLPNQLSRNMAQAKDNSWRKERGVVMLN
jgi:hypothetical protein